MPSATNCVTRLDEAREQARNCRNSAHELALRIESQRAARAGPEQNLKRMQDSRSP